MVVVLMRLLPGLVRCLAVLEVGVACRPMAALAALWQPVWQAIAGAGVMASVAPAKKSAQKYFVKHKLLPYVRTRRYAAR